MTRRHAFLTPDSLDGAPVCYPLAIPEHLYIYLQGALLPLSLQTNWEQHGTITPDEAAQYWLDLLEQLERGFCEMDQPLWHAEQASNETISHDTLTTLVSHDIVINTGDGEDFTWSAGEVTVKKPGLYKLDLNVAWASVASDTSLRRCAIAVNGTNKAIDSRNAVAGEISNNAAWRIINLAADDVVSFKALHKRGASTTVNVVSGEQRTNMTIRRLRE